MLILSSLSGSPPEESPSSVRAENRLLRAILIRAIIDRTRWNSTEKDRESAHQWLFEEFEKGDRVTPFTLQYILQHLPEVDHPESWAERIRASVLSDDAPERFQKLSSAVDMRGSGGRTK